MMTDVKSPLLHINEQIKSHCERVGRDPHSVQLLAVSKTRTADELAKLADQGQRHFGENYLQEALAKIAALRGRGLVWHFIGPIQSNKTRDIAAHFDWVHSVDRLKVARRLSEQRPPESAPLNLCIQIGRAHV